MAKRRRRRRKRNKRKPTGWKPYNVGRRLADYHGVNIKMRQAFLLNTATDGSLTVAISPQSFTNFLSLNGNAKQPFNSLEVTSLKRLYDSYRVYGLSIVCIPSFNNSQSHGTGSTGGDPNLLGTNPAGIMVYDVDQDALSMGIQDVLDHNGLRIIDPMKKWNYYKQLPKTTYPDNVQPRGFLNIESEASNTAGTWFMNHISSFTNGSGNPVSSQQMYTFVITLYARFQNRK